MYKNTRDYMVVWLDFLFYLVAEWTVAVIYQSCVTITGNLAHIEMLNSNI